MRSPEKPEKAIFPLYLYEWQGGLSCAHGPAGGLPHWSEGKPVMRRGTMQTQRGQVIRGGVAFVLPQTILRIDEVPFDHQTVALDLGQNGSCGNRYAPRVAVNQGFLLDQCVK